MCVCVCVRASLTAHELVLADCEHTPALQHLRVGAAGADGGQEGLLRHPDRKPLQLAVTQQAGGVETPVRARERQTERERSVTHQPRRTVHSGLGHGGGLC